MGKNGLGINLGDILTIAILGGIGYVIFMFATGKWKFGGGAVEAVAGAGAALSPAAGITTAISDIASGKVSPSGALGAAWSPAVATVYAGQAIATAIAGAVAPAPTFTPAQIAAQAKPFYIGTTSQVTYGVSRLTDLDKLVLAGMNARKGSTVGARQGY
jgi:hypothetical protein